MGGTYTYSAVTVVHVFHTFMSLLNFTELNSTAICQNKCKQTVVYTMTFLKRQELLATMRISRGTGMIFKCKLNLRTKLQCLQWSNPSCNHPEAIDFCPWAVILKVFPKTSNGSTSFKTWFSAKFPGGDGHISKVFRKRLFLFYFLSQRALLYNMVKDGS